MLSTRDRREESNRSPRSVHPSVLLLGPAVVPEREIHRERFDEHRRLFTLLMYFCGGSIRMVGSHSDGGMT